MLARQDVRNNARHCLRGRQLRGLTWRGPPYLICAECTFQLLKAARLSVSFASFDACLLGPRVVEPSRSFVTQPAAILPLFACTVLFSSL
jgi:hypothetical protein